MHPAQLKEAGCPGRAFVHLLVRVHLTQGLHHLSQKQPTVETAREPPRITVKTQSPAAPVPCSAPAAGYGSYLLGSLVTAYLLKLFPLMPSFTELRVHICPMVTWVSLQLPEHTT